MSLPDLVEDNSVIESKSSNYLANLTSKISEVSEDDEN
jgi:hypothetical protein